MDKEYNYYKTDDDGEEGEVNFVLQPMPEEEKEERHETEAKEEAVTERAFSSEEQRRQPQGERKTTNHPRKQKKQHKTAWKVAACVGMAVLFGVVASATYQTSNYLTEKLLGKRQVASGNQVTQSGTTKLNKSTSVISSDITDIVKNSMPSVVSITNMSVKEVQSFFGGSTQQEVTSSGSGVIVGKNDKELLVLSNNHVVEGNTTLTVSFVDNESVEGVVKGADPSRDVAVVAIPLETIKESTLNEIKLATIGDSSSLQVGEPVIAIGNALGYGQSVTDGIVSAKDRELQGFKGKLIQTNAAINPGNSGGALLNANGEVVGINTAKITGNIVEGAEGMGFAIQISDIDDLLENLMNKETRAKVSDAQRGYLGISGFDVTEESAAMYHMEKGVYVSEVQEHGGAKKAGVIRGSIITGFEGIDIETMEDLQEQLQYYKAGEKVKVKLEVPANRGEFETETVEITLGRRAQ